MDWLSGIGSLIGGVGSLIDGVNGSDAANRYNDASAANNAWNQQFQEHGASWQDQNNQDMIAWLMAMNPSLVQGVVDTNAANEGFANYVNSQRTDFTNGFNDWALDRANGAVNTAMGNYGDLSDIAQYIMSGGDVDRLTGSGDLLTGYGLDALDQVGQYDDAASALLGDLTGKPYDLNTMTRDYETAAMRGVDRAYEDASEQASRQAMRSGQASAGQSQLEKMASRRAMDTADASLNARIAAPSAYENLMSSMMGRTGSAISSLRSDSTSLRNVGQQGLSGGASAYNSAGGMRTNQGQVAGNLKNAGAQNALTALMFQPNFQDPSSGLLNPRAGWQNPISAQNNPYAATTNPYTGYRPVQNPSAPMITAPWGTAANSITNIAQGLNGLFGGNNGASNVPINTNPTYPSRTNDAPGGY